MKNFNSAKDATLKGLLEETITKYTTLDRRDQDPVSTVWAYEDADDREVVALVASSMAYGRVDLLRPATRHALTALGPHPARFLRENDTTALNEKLDDFTYRMTRGPDLLDLFTAIATTLRTDGSLKALYLKHRPSPPDHGAEALHQTHLTAASGFVRTLHTRRLRPTLHRGFRYLLPDPADGSTCKRLHLFFRWMSRGPDAIDLGLWPELLPKALLMPLDTHTSRLCRYLGLLSRKSLDQKAALEVTRHLLRLDSHDPLRYDFALCHLGISRDCIHRRSPLHCPRCPIENACTKT